MLVRDLQEKAARALPVEHVHRHGRWWLRHTEGPSWWAGTVLPHGHEHGTDLHEAVATAERFSARFATTPVFQITPGARPDGLDALLAARGYRDTSPMSLRTAAVPDVLARTRTTEHHLATAPDETWLAMCGAAHGTDMHRERDLLARVAHPSGYVTVRSGGEPVAVGRATVDHDRAGVFSMATVPRARGTGAGSAVLAALAEWAAQHSATGLHLQVDPANSAALRLYERAGFIELGGYHYRVRAG